MPRSATQNTVARERAMESILEAAIDLFSERGMHASTIAEIARRAGVAQGLVNYHFGSKEQLAGAVIDRCQIAQLEIVQAQQGTADERLKGVIDATFLGAEHAHSLHRAVLALQGQPSAASLFVEAAIRNADELAAIERLVRDIFRERGAADPALEEIMLRTTLEGVVARHAVYGDAFPLADARRWVLRSYGLSD